MQFILDLDGTVLDCSRRFHALFRELVAESSLNLQDYWDLKRIPRSHDWILTDHYGWTGVRRDQFRLEWLDRVESERFLGFDAPLSGARQALAQLADAGKLILLTSRQLREPVLRQLAEHELAGFFDRVIVTAGRGSKVDVVRAERLTLSPSDMLVGDTETDIETARGLGVKAISVGSGCRSESFLAQHGPDHMYDDIFRFASERSRLSA